MYLRHTTIRKSGKTHTYWRLVRSVRVGRRVQQQTVAMLGELDSKGRAKARALASQFGGHVEAPGLFDKKSSLEKPVPVLLDRVRTERGREFGGVWIAWTLWRALRLDTLLESLLPPGGEDVPWSRVAEILVAARLCDPSSELHIAEDWYRKTALEDLLGVPADRVNDDRLYRALDKLLPHKAELEKHLKARLGELFKIDYDLLLYDMTSTYFEGQVAGNPIALRGHSSDQRPDCKQVCIALVVTRDGMPLGYEIFPGNKVGVTTVEEVVSIMEGRYGKADRIWVMDRGMVSEENLDWLRSGARRYLLGTSRHELRQFAAALAEKRDWNEIRPDVSVKICPGPDGEETFILCRSEARQEKEKAMHEKFSARILDGLESLRRRVERSRKKLDRADIGTQVGRLLGQNSRAAGKYRIEIEDAPDRAAGLIIHWEINSEWTDWATLSEGAYVLRTNIKDWTPESLWKTYIQLTDAEAAFRIHKSDLCLRPIWHHKEDRVKAHILVCFLAYVLWKTLEQWQSAAGLGNSPRTIIEELGRIQCTDVVLPTADDRELRLRCVVQPDRAQNLLLQRLGLRLPRRLTPIGGAKM
jgi:transposase